MSSKDHHQPQISSSGVKKTEKIQLPKPVIDFQFKNPTPMANPYGPYFKEIDIPALLRARQNEVEFKTSTLERKHVWQLHLGNDLGLKLDLVDQNAFLNDPSGAPPLNSEDKIFVVAESHHGQRGRVRFGEEAQLPQFFRQTVYIDNNPFNQRNKNQTGIDSTKATEEKRKLIDSSKDIFAADFIEKSFSLADLTVAKLVKENAKKRKLVWSKPLVPEDANVGAARIKRSLIRFTEDPSHSSGYDTIEAFAEGADSKRFRIDESILFNTRQSGDDGKSASTHITLVAPSINNEEEEASQFEWVRDFEMDTQDTKLVDNYIIALKDSSDHAIYFPLSSKFDMKKITMEDSQPHRCIVSRSEE